MKNIELLELEGKLQNTIMEFVLEYDGYFKKEQIDAILNKGESGLQDLRLILKAYNQRHLKYLDIEHYANVYYISTVIAALAYLNDETVFDDMLEYLYTSPILIQTAWGDDFNESLPMYYAKFSNKIDTLKQVIYDPELIVDTKSILMIGLCSMPTILNKPELNEPISNIFLEYLRFLLAPQNLKTQDKLHDDFYKVTHLVEDAISGYVDCGGDSNHPFVQQAIEDGLFVYENLFGFEELDDWEIFVFPLRDIYASNEFWIEKEEKNKIWKRNLGVKSHKKQDILNILNTTKLFSKFIAPDDRINVKYKVDGKVVNEIEFKEVEDDLISGKCELI